MKGQDIVLLLKLNIIRRKEIGLKDLIKWKDADLSKLDWDIHSKYLSEKVSYSDQFVSRHTQDFDESSHQYVGYKNELAYWSTRYSLRGLANETAISKSEVAIALQRCMDAGLASRDERDLPCVNTRELLEFLVYGIRYVFPVRLGEVTRGIKTSFAAPVLEGKLMGAGDLVPVWPDPQGTAKGQAVEPLFKSVPIAVKGDLELYAMLALIDSIRLGQARERNVARDLLERHLRHVPERDYAWS